MKNNRLQILFLSILISLLTFACTIFIGGPAYPEKSIPISTQAAGEFLTYIESAATAGSETGTVSIIITESQLTSYFAMKLADQTDPMITNPQVYLQDNEIQIFGTAQQGYFQATISIILTARVNEDGSLSIDFTSADLGPLPVPDGFADTLTSLIEEAFTGTIGPVATGIRLTDISISEGRLTLTGETR